MCNAITLKINKKKEICIINLVTVSTIKVKINFKKWHTHLKELHMPKVSFICQPNVHDCFKNFS